MYSQTYIARDIFGCVWSLGILGAIGNSDRLSFPFDSQLKSHVEKYHWTLVSLWSSIGRATGLSEQILRMGLDEAPWRRIGHDTGYYDELAISSELVLTSGRREWHAYDYSDIGAIKTIVRNAAGLQLTKLLDSLFQARFCFWEKSEVTLGHFIEHCLHIMSLAVHLLACASPLGDDPLSETYRQWLRTKVPLSLKPGAADARYQTWLMQLIAEFRAFTKGEKEEER